MDTANPRHQPEAERPSPLPAGQAPPPAGSGRGCTWLPRRLPTVATSPA